MAAPAELPRVPVGPELDNRRVAAALIDLAVPATLALAVTAAGLDLTVPMLIAVAGWTLFYFFALESAGGQTVGKRLMGVRVVRPDGGPADLRQVGIRTVVRIADGPVVGLIAMLVTGERRQRLGDLAAGTVVTHADAVAVEEPPRADPHAMTAVLEPARDELPARGERPPALPSLAASRPPPAANPAPSAPASPPPAAEGPDLTAYLERDPVVEPLAEPDYEDEPEYEPFAGPADPDGDGPVVKPIETISAIDQLMQETEEQHRRG